MLSFILSLLSSLFFVLLLLLMPCWCYGIIIITKYYSFSSSSSLLLLLYISNTSLIHFFFRVVVVLQLRFFFECTRKIIFEKRKKIKCNKYSHKVCALLISSIALFPTFRANNKKNNRVNVPTYPPLAVLKNAGICIRPPRAEAKAHRAAKQEDGRKDLS